MTQRHQHPMPDDIASEIASNGVQEAYDARPPYQRNDYVGWIGEAKREETRIKRINQMISELQAGDVYMKMPWGLSATKNARPPKPQTLDEFINTNDAPFEEIIGQLDTALFTIHPDYTCKYAWGGWAYRIGTAYSCLIVPYKDHVKLLIWRGTMLSDPNNQLQGEGTNVQHLRFEPEDDIDQEYLRELLEEQRALYESGVAWEGRD